MYFKKLHIRDPRTLKKLLADMIEFTYQNIRIILNNIRKKDDLFYNEKNCATWTAFTRCRHILKTMKNVTVANFELAFTRCRNNLKTVGNLPVKSSLQDFDAKEMCLNPKIRSVSFKKRLKMFYFHHF